VTLYPTTAVDISTINTMGCIESSSLLTIAITVPSLGGIKFAMSQMSPTQDYSIRVWFSILPGGDFIPTNASYWHLNRYVDQILTLYDINANKPTGSNILAIGVPSGNYNLNLLNLVNSENVFSFLATML